MLHKSERKFIMKVKSIKSNNKTFFVVEFYDLTEKKLLLKGFDNLIIESQNLGNNRLINLFTTMKNKISSRADDKYAGNEIFESAILFPDEVADLIILALLGIMTMHK